MTDDDVIARVHYFDEQFLRLQDFQDEQQYHVDMQRRHNISGHSWGIVGGLDVTAQNRQFVQVTAGSAVDPWGRVIVLAHGGNLPIPPRVESLDVRIRYDEGPSDQVDDGCGGSGAYRIQEFPRLELQPSTDRAAADQPATVPGQTPAPDSDPWILLGRVELNPLRPDDPPVVRLENRQYTGLVGVSVTAPSGNAELRFSGGPGRGGDPGSFTVLTQLSKPATGPASVLKPVLTISGDGRAQVTGDLTVDGSLTLDGEELVFGALPKEPAAAPAPATGAATATVTATVTSGDSTSEAAVAQSVSPPPPDPWSIRQVEAPLPATRTAGQTPPPVPQIQIVLPEPIAGQEPATFSIGTWSKDSQRFEAALTVHADGNVEIRGTLRVGALKGLNSDDLPPGTVVDGGLDPEARRMVTAAGMSAVAGGSVLAGKLFQPGTSVQAEPPPSAPAPPAIAAAGGEPAPGLAEMLAALLASNQTLLTQFAQQLTANHLDQAQSLRRALPTPAAAKKLAENPETP